MYLFNLYFRYWGVFLAAFFLHASLCHSQPLSRQQLEEDLRFLEAALIQQHPNLYTYSSPSQVADFFDQILPKSKASFSPQEAYYWIASVSSLVKDGHSYIYPSSAHLNAFYETAPLLPFETMLSEAKLWVSKDFTKKSNLPPGVELISINAVPATELIALANSHLPRDGDNLNYPRHLISTLLPAYFSFFYGFSEEYTVQYKGSSGGIVSVTLEGRTRSALQTARLSGSTTVQSREKGIHLDLYPDHKLAVLKVPSFDNGLLKSEFHQKFKPKIRALFQQIEAAEIEHVAIDLRDNQGGALSNGVFLLKHFMERPFQCVDSYYKKSRKDGSDLKQMNNKWDGFEYPFRHHYLGKVYLFINGGSFSCSSIVANSFQQNDRGLILGAMTGGSAFVNSGGPTQTLVLPNSQIVFKIPQTQYRLRKDLLNLGTGVEPDFNLLESITQRLEDIDPCLLKLKQIISP